MLRPTRNPIDTHMRTEIPTTTDPHPQTHTVTPEGCWRYLRSRTCLATTPGWVDLPSGTPYRKSLQSHTTAYARCQPFFTPVGLGI